MCTDFLLVLFVCFVYTALFVTCIKKSSVQAKKSSDRAPSALLLISPVDDCGTAAESLMPSAFPQISRYITIFGHRSVFGPCLFEALFFVKNPQL